MRLQLLAHGSQHGLVQLVDGPVELVNRIIALLLAWALLTNGHNETLDGVSHGLGVGGQQLPHRRVIWIESKALGRGEET